MVKALRAILITALVGVSSSVSADEGEPGYAFEKFLGEWKLKDDRFQQVWDGKTIETLSIPRHRTDCSKVNTEQSVLCKVDAVDFQGHILWAADQTAGEIHHLSHFGSSRLGRGIGKLDPDGNLRLRIHFSDEPDATYRVYDYRWISDDEYEMISRQYDDQGRATGNWYGGSFVRVEDGE